MTIGTATDGDVWILGGGVAGLTAAVHLAEAGLRPHLLEAAPHPGGRARSFADPAFDAPLDNGPHLLVGAYVQMLDLLTRLGSRADLADPSGNRYDFWEPGRGWTQLQTPEWPGPWHLGGALFGATLLPLADRLRVLRLAPGLGTGAEDRRDLDGVSATQWLLRHGQTPALFQRLWTPLCLATLNEPPASACAALFIQVLRRMFLSGGDAARPLLSRQPLSRLIAEPARRRIEERGGSVRCGVRVCGLETGRDRLQAIHLRQAGRGGPPGPHTVRRPAAVIAALPHTALTRLLPQWAGERGFDQLQAAPIVSVHLAYAEPVRLPVAMTGLPGASSQWLIDYSHLAETPLTGGRISAVLSAAYREGSWTATRLVETVHGDLTRILPEWRHHPPRAARVVKERRATFAPWPGSARQRPGAETPWRNLWLAGDWTDTGLPATLEGAAVSGARAARKVLDFLAAGG